MDLTKILSLRRCNEPVAPPKASIAPIVPKGPVRRSAPASISFAALPEKARLKAQERLRFVQLVRTVAHDERLKLPQAVNMVSRRYLSAFPILSISGHGGRSALTYTNFRNWSPLVHVSAQRADTLQKLADGYARGPQPPKGPASFWQYLATAWLSSHKLTVTAAYDVAVKRLHIEDPELVAPSLNQATYYISKIDKSITILAREGEVAWKNSVMDYITRDWSGIRPGDMLVGDSRTFDSRCKIWDEQASKWLAIRPTICALMDARSSRFAAWSITPEPVNSWLITNTLGLYCSSQSPPLYVYFDNGKDYTASGFATPIVVDGHEHSILKSLGITMLNSLPYNGKAKIIERRFRDQMQRFDKLMPDYLGSKPQERTMDAAWYDAHPEDLPSLHEFIAAFSAWLAEWHSTPLQGNIMRGRSPDEVWADRPGDRPPLSNDQLYFAFARPIGTRQVVRGPAVIVGSRRYFCNDLPTGGKVLVKLSHFDPDACFCCTLDGSLIGEAHTRDAIPAVAVTDDDRGMLADLMKRIGKMRKDAFTALDTITGGKHIISTYELLTAPPNSDIRRLGTIGSIKGASHRYAKLTLNPLRAEVPRAPMDVQPRAPDPADPALVALINQARHDFNVPISVPKPVSLRASFNPIETTHETPAPISIRDLPFEDDNF